MAAFPTANEVDSLITRLERRQSSGGSDENGVPYDAQATPSAAVGRLTPVTVFQIVSAVGTVETGNHLRINQRDVTLVSLVCRATAKCTEGSTTTFALEDHTGTVAAIYTPMDAAAFDPVTMAEQYVKVIARGKGPASTRHLDIDTILHLTTANELTSHLLSVMFATLRASRGDLQRRLSTEIQIVQQQPATASAVGSQLSPTQYRVLAACQTAPNVGLSTAQIVDALSDHANPEEVHASLQWLFSDGLIYTTKSDDRWKSEEPD
jgi:hypothetical protein